MKTTLFDAELLKEHDEAKNSLIRQLKAELWTILYLDVAKITMKIEKKKAFCQEGDFPHALC